VFPLAKALSANPTLISRCAFIAMFCTVGVTTHAWLERYGATVDVKGEARHPVPMVLKKASAVSSVRNVAVGYRSDALRRYVES